VPPHREERDGTQRNISTAIDAERHAAACSAAPRCARMQAAEKQQTISGAEIAVAARRLANEMATARASSTCLEPMRAPPVIAGPSGCSLSRQSDTGRGRSRTGERAAPFTRGWASKRSIEGKHDFRATDQYAVRVGSSYRRSRDRENVAQMVRYEEGFGGRSGPRLRCRYGAAGNQAAANSGAPGQRTAPKASAAWAAEI